MKNTQIITLQFLSHLKEERLTSWREGKQHSMEKEQHMQRPWGIREHGVFEDGKSGYVSESRERGQR